MSAFTGRRKSKKLGQRQICIVGNVGSSFSGARQQMDIFVKVQSPMFFNPPIVFFVCDVHRQTFKAGCCCCDFFFSLHLEKVNKLKNRICNSIIKFKDDI